MLTTEQLNAIKERAEKATAGPWEKSVLTNGYILSGEKLNVVASTVEFKDDGSIHNTFTKNYENNRSFIAHARTDIPSLIAEVEKLRDEISLLCPIGDYDVITSLKSEKQYQAEIIAKLQSKIATYESLAQEFDYGAILDEMACEGGGAND